MPSFMVYGATGYTGSLIAREAVRRGMRPVLAGRNAGNLATLAGELGLEHRAFSLDSPRAVADGLRGVHTLLNCAGPFSRTARPIADACLGQGTHYLDITGEADVFEALARRDAEARAAGPTLAADDHSRDPGPIDRSQVLQQRLDGQESHGRGGGTQVVHSWEPVLAVFDADPPPE